MGVKNKALLYAFSIVIAFGSFVFGYALVCISMMADNIQTAHPIDAHEFDFQLSLITTLLPLGAFLGTFNFTYALSLCSRFAKSSVKIRP
jgi:hypothetical protein